MLTTKFYLLWVIPSLIPGTGIKVLPMETKLLLKQCVSYSCWYLSCSVNVFKKKKEKKKKDYSSSHQLDVWLNTNILGILFLVIHKSKLLKDICNVL